ncbi:hypothetical protein [Paenibacillus odorifer]|uniref:hypothetical protein n=1 Tax=Paenibacillus odorifer TaxID=189426 RepID=UPI00096D22B1|nr:hypothetical protein [Paenibacillus odorifer]OMD09848.1 hypothetical protein BJP50_29385 [Paenibacillus odorifer]
MTVVIGILTNDFSILATDTRTCYENDNNEFFNDQSLKLRSLNYPHGWLAGLGYSSFLDHYHELSCMIVNPNTDNYCRAYAQVANTMLQQNPDQLNDIIGSCCYHTFIHNGDLRLNYSYFNETKQSCTVDLMEGRFQIGFPYNYPAESRKWIVENYIESEIEMGLDSFILKLLEIFKEISLKSNAVSEICEIGILNKVGHIQKYSFSGHVDSLLALYQEKLKIDANIQEH